MGHSHRLTGTARPALDKLLSVPAVSGVEPKPSDTAGLLQWTSECLGIDGVIVDEIAEDFITGQGEWNPPGGWKPFQVNVQTGKIHTNSESL